MSLPTLCRGQPSRRTHAIASAWNWALIALGLCSTPISWTAWASATIGPLEFAAALVGAFVLTAVGLVGLTMLAGSAARFRTRSFNVIFSVVQGPIYPRAVRCLPDVSEHDASYLLDFFQTIASAIQIGAIDESIAKAILKTDLAAVQRTLRLRIATTTDLDTVRWLAQRWRC